MLKFVPLHTVCARQVFGLMNLIIERLGQDVIAPHVRGILPLLPRIWEAAADQSLLRIQVGGIRTGLAVLQAGLAQPTSGRQQWQPQTSLLRVQV